MKRNVIYLFSLLFTAFVFFGCPDKPKEDKPETEQNEQTDDKGGATRPDGGGGSDASDRESVDGDSEDSTDAQTTDLDFADQIIGTWTGNFSNKPFTLKIKNVEGNTFTGTTKVEYVRNTVINDFTGEINPEDLTFTMKVPDAELDKGVYKGVFNGELTKLSGKFTLESNGRKFSFKANKSK